jgi:hypothetical protein
MTISRLKRFVTFYFRGSQILFFPKIDLIKAHSTTTRKKIETYIRIKIMIPYSN